MLAMLSTEHANHDMFVGAAGTELVMMSQIVVNSGYQWAQHLRIHMQEQKRFRSNVRLVLVLVSVIALWIYIMLSPQISR